MEKTDPTQPIVICDAGPLIHLDELGCLGLLSDFQSVIVPEAVWLEVERHRPALLSHPHSSLLRTKANALPALNYRPSPGCSPSTPGNGKLFAWHANTPTASC